MDEDRRSPGQFGDSYEWAGGFKWYFIPNQRVWLNGEIMRVNKAAYGSTITPYTGWNDRVGAGDANDLQFLTS